MNIANIGNIITRNAYLYTDKKAIHLPDYATSITFSELDIQTNQWARYLFRLGVRRHTIAGIVLKDPLKIILIYLALAKLGAIAVPLSPSLSQANIKDMISYTKACYLFFEEKTVKLIYSCEGLKVNVLNDKESAVKLFNESGDTLEGVDGYDNIKETDNFIYLYTSGSTGIPKIVPMSHDRFIANASDVARYLSITQSDCFYSLTTLFHAHGFYNGLLLPLCCGASTVILENFTVFHITKFWNYVKQYGITVINIVPTILEMLSSMKSIPMLGQTRNLRFAICGTALLPEEKRLQFEQTMSIKVIRQYGLTETLINTIEPLDGPRKIDSVGKAIGGKVKIVRGDGKEILTNNIGEVAISGTSVMSSYLNSADQRDKISKKRWFLTGDLGRIDEDGYLFIEGRKKDLIIKGGKNIQPKEINDVILRYPGIKEVATLGLPNDFYGDEIYSFVVLNNQAQTIKESVCIEWCRKFLESYKCPKRVIFVKELPKGPTGKIQINKLKQEWLNKAAI